jgi:predicted ester cyclase
MTSLDPHDAESVKVVRDVIERVWQGGDPQAASAAIEELFGSEISGEIAEYHGQLTTGFSDFTVHIDDMIVDGDTVAARLTLSGRHTGTFAGVEPTGRSVRWCSMRWFEVHKGRVVETWAMQDRLGLLQQLGALPEITGVNWASALQS